MILFCVYNIGMVNTLTDGERDILAELNRDARESYESELIGGHDDPECPECEASWEPVDGYHGAAILRCPHCQRPRDLDNPYSEGFNASNIHEARTANPYQSPSEAAELWLLGWDACDAYVPPTEYDQA